MRKYLLSIIILVISILIFGCKIDIKNIFTSEEKKVEQITEAINKGSFFEARNLVRKYYADDEEKGVSWMLVISEEESNLYKNRVIIEEGWKTIREGNYFYIRGRVRNTGNRTIDYFKLTAHFKDANKNVIDTDYTNSNETIGPDMAKEFEIMHKYSTEYKFVSVFIEEVSLK